MKYGPSLIEFLNSVTKLIHILDNTKSFLLQPFPPGFKFSYSELLELPFFSLASNTISYWFPWFLFFFCGDKKLSVLSIMFSSKSFDNDTILYRPI